jgi:hypothetical protein
MTVAQVKAEKAFSIGLAPYYCLPVPLPLKETSVAGEVPLSVIEMLKVLGFHEDEIDGNEKTMAKAFCRSLTHAQASGEIPWDEDHCATPVHNGDNFTQPWKDIDLPLDVLMGRMQIALGKLGFQWFHPDDRTLFARSTKGVSVTLRAERPSDSLTQMDIRFSHADDDTIKLIHDHLKKELSTD